MITIFISISLSDSSAHRSGCHRWHTCPSDTGSYTYVPKYEKFEDDDKPKYDRCPNGYNKNDEGICKKKIKNNSNDNQYENRYGFKENDYLPQDKNNLYNNDYDNTKGLFPEDSVTSIQNICNPINESILLKKILSPKGVRILADFDTCQIASGKITLKIPDNPNLKLAAIYIDKNGNNHEGTLLSPKKIQKMDKKQGLFVLELNEQMKGKNPITGKSNTLTKINGLALFNASDKAIKFKSGNVVEVIATFTK